MGLLTKAVIKIETNSFDKNNAKLWKDMPPIEGIKVTDGLNYTNNKEEKFRLFNIYEPVDPIDSLPVVIDIHGGGWMYGDRNLNGEFAKYCASLGTKVLTFSYRILDKVKLIEMVQDVFEFMHYISKNAAELHLNLKKCAIVGDSAGGHLTLLFMAINASKELQEIYKVEPVDLDVSFICLQHACASLNQTIFGGKGKLLDIAMNFYRKALFGRKRKTDKIYLNSSIDQFAKYLKLPKVLAVSATGDDLKKNNDLMLKVFDENDIKYEYKEYEGLFHVFQVMKYDLKESKEINSYMIELFKQSRKLSGNMSTSKSDKK